MNNELWDKIVAFDLDNPPSEYCFSIRLANENFWTKNFAENAILEYKKFMYLAASSDFMVSPSEIVDSVWHQHLIFTQSYQDFCNLLGKQIQHIPSTHNKEEFSKFKQAKERTLKFYENNFGEQPKSIWGYSGMYESLNLEKAKYKLRTFIIAALLAFLALITPAYFLLRPIYSELDNPYFMLGFIGLMIGVFVALDFFNKTRIKQIINQFDKNSFVYTLTPLELIYLKTQKLTDVINGVVNGLVEREVIKISTDDTVELAINGAATCKEELQVTTELSEIGNSYYYKLLKRLVTKPIFTNHANCMNAFKKYFNKSKKFGSIFYINFGVLALLLMFGLVRIATGLLRDKPVTQISIVVILFAVLIVVYLNRLTNHIGRLAIPNLYKREILPSQQIEGDWQWSYFLLGMDVLTPSFSPLVRQVDKNYSGSGGDASNSCGSSCGSSCSSCGGCGGGD
ncbi:MAG: hypothetical protein ACKVOW_21420 [Chitinophagaceae bacterium]